MSRVLMVDDAALFQLLEASFVRRAACDIVRVAGGAELLERARQAPPDVIVLDAALPGIDGPGCLRALKADPALAPIPVIVVADAAEGPGLCEAGADVTLSRPVAPGALEVALCAVEQVLQRRGPRRAARLQARVTAPGGPPRRARVKDISRSGLFLALREPLPIDAPLALSLRLPGPGGAAGIAARGVVVRQVAPDRASHLIPGVGVRFVEIDAQSAARIDAFVRQPGPAAGPGASAGGDRDASDRDGRG